MKAGEGRLLVRASATILFVRKGMSLTNPALTVRAQNSDRCPPLIWRDKLWCTGSHESGKYPTHQKYLGVLHSLSWRVNWCF